MQLHVHRLASVERLAELAATWNRLCGDVPTRRWEWLGTWWECYGEDGELFVLQVLDDNEQTVGLVPWYLDRSPLWGRTVRFLGSGEVCSDYLSILCRPEDREAVVAAVAAWLSEASQGAHGAENRWDRLELIGADAADPAINRLVEQLGHSGALIHQRPGLNCWRVQLPGDWESYLKRFGRWHRKQTRRVDRRGFESGRAVAHFVQEETELPRAMEIFKDLHQRRRNSLGEPGCFASPRFDRFLHLAAPRMQAAGMLHICWIELDGLPAAIDFQMEGGGVCYVYQGGVDPDRLRDEPGRMIYIAAIRDAIERGCTAFDFMRGDEPYKAHWRAEPQPTFEFRLAADRPLSRLRLRMWLLAGQVKRWVLSHFGPKKVASTEAVDDHEENDTGTRQQESEPEASATGEKQTSRGHGDAGAGRGGEGERGSREKTKTAGRSTSAADGEGETSVTPEEHEICS